MCSRIGAFGGSSIMNKSRKFVIFLASVGINLSSIPFCNPAHAREPSRPKFQSQSDDIVKSVTQKAEEGMAEAQMVLAKWRYDGSVLPEDHAEAVRWYGMAANQGNVEAMMALGRMLNEGDGVPKDARKGCDWYVSAARKGKAEAFLELGKIFETGAGVKADMEKAIWLYKEAAGRGETNATARLVKLVDTNSPDEAEGLIDVSANGNTKVCPGRDSAATGSKSHETTANGLTQAEKEEAVRFNLEVQRRAEQEWNEFARQNGGLQFTGGEGSGQPSSSSGNRSGWDSGQSEEAVLAYANGIAELVGTAAGFECQISPLLETIKRHERMARYSTDWTVQRYALRQAEAWMGTLNGVMEQYKIALGRLINLSIRDGMIFHDAMRMLSEMPECNSAVRSYCRRFVLEADMNGIPNVNRMNSSYSTRYAPAPIQRTQSQRVMRQGWLDAVQASTLSGEELQRLIQAQ